MEKLLGDSLVILYFVVGLTIICYGNFRVAQKVILLYTITYATCFLDILDSKAALAMACVLFFAYFEYLTEDYDKLKIIKDLRYKTIDAFFLLIFQYHYLIFMLSICMQTYVIRNIFVNSWWDIICRICSVLLLCVCIHKTSMQKFEITTISRMMKIINKYPLYQFPHEKINPMKYHILIGIEDKSYFIRANTYNFFSWEFVRYRWKRFWEYMHRVDRKGKVKRTTSAVKNYIRRTKHIRGYSTLEMQLIRNIGLENGYNCVLRRKIYEIVYTKIFFTSLKDYFADNYYTNRNYYKEYLLWLYCHCVRTKINGVEVKPLSNAFVVDEMGKWSNEGMFVACMGLSNKSKYMYYEEPFSDMIKDNDLNEKKIFRLYQGFGEGRKLY